MGVLDPPEGCTLKEGDVIKVKSWWYKDCRVVKVRVHKIFLKGIEVFPFHYGDDERKTGNPHIRYVRHDAVVEEEE